MSNRSPEKAHLTRICCRCSLVATVVRSRLLSGTIRGKCRRRVPRLGHGDHITLSKSKGTLALIVDLIAKAFNPRIS